MTEDWRIKLSHSLNSQICTWVQLEADLFRTNYCRPGLQLVFSICCSRSSRSYYDYDYISYFYLVGFKIFIKNSNWFSSFDAKKWKEMFWIILKQIFCCLIKGHHSNCKIMEQGRWIVKFWDIIYYLVCIVL